MWFDCFKNRETKRYIFRHDNKLRSLGLIDKDLSKKDNLDFNNINIWICDTNFKIVYGKEDKINKLDPNILVGKYIYDIDPKDLGIYWGDLHKQAQNNKEPVKLNMLINDKIVYIVVKPIIYFNEVIASILVIIPYKTYDKAILTNRRSREY
jgi:hypothetical protein